jgi:hypothetical protein
MAMSELDDYLDAAIARGVGEMRAKMKGKPRVPGEAKPAKRGNPERDAQRAVVKWLRKAGCIVSATINEQGARSKDAAERARFGAARKMSGVTTGFPDLTVITPNGAIFFVEMKSKVGVASDEQKAMLADMAQRGIPAWIARDIWGVQEGMKLRGITLDRPRLTMQVPVQPLQPMPAVMAP